MSNNVFELLGAKIAVSLENSRERDGNKMEDRKRERERERELVLTSEIWQSKIANF